MNRIKVALIGCGFFGKQLADSFHKANAELVGFTDLNLSLANQLADKFSVNAYADAEELLEKTAPDLVLIATYNYAHKEPAVTALQYGTHIFIETPFTIRQQECLEIMRLAEEKKRTVFVGHLLRTLPGVMKAKQFINENLLGKITVARANRQRWIDSSSDKNWWKNNVNLTGENAAYSRLYLHNTASEKWQFLNSYKDGTITADTAGSYLLTNQNLRFTNINWTFFIAAGALTVVCLIVYIAVKKRYWFW